MKTPEVLIIEFNKGYVIRIYYDNILIDGFKYQKTMENILIYIKETLTKYKKEKDLNFELDQTFIEYRGYFSDYLNVKNFRDLERIVLNRNSK